MPGRRLNSRPQSRPHRRFLQIRWRRAPRAPRLASASSRPSVRTTIDVPRAAASSRRPMMLFPSTSRPRASTRTCDSKRTARWTNRAAARACIPSSFTMVTERSVISSGTITARTPAPIIRIHHAVLYVREPTNPAPRTQHLAPRTQRPFRHWFFRPSEDRTRPRWRFAHDRAFRAPQTEGPASLEATPA